MARLNKLLFIIVVAALTSACKTSGGVSGESAANGGAEKSIRSGRSTSGSNFRYRINNDRTRMSYRGSTDTQSEAVAPGNTSPRPVPASAPEQPAPTPEIVRADPAPRPVPAPVPAPELPPQQPAPEPEPEPTQVLGNVELTWTIPTKRENGNELPHAELSHYEVYYTSDAGKSDTLRVDDPSRTRLTVKDLEEDTYYFAMVAVDQDGVFSALSNEVPKTIK